MRHDSPFPRPFPFARLSPLRTCLLLTGAALLVRLTVMLFVAHDVVRSGHDSWDFGHEQGRIARSIAQGKGFSNPLDADTGPTAWQPPVYPYLLAGMFRVFGIYSRTSALVAVSLNCLFAALTCIPLYYFARRSFGQETAALAGSFWIIFPYSVYWSIERVWDTWLATLLLGILFLIVLHLESSDRLLSWAGFGLLTGFAALTNPVVLSVMPGLGLWMIHGLRKNGRRWLLPACVGVLCASAAVAPWILRNYVVFHRLIPIRDSMGFEFAVGNDGDYSREFDLRDGPWLVRGQAYNPEWARYQAVGEIAYFDEKAAEAWAHISSHRAEYVLCTLRRIVNIWTDFWSLSPDYLRREPLSPIQWPLCTLLSCFTFYGLRRAFQANAWSAMPYAIVLLCFPFVYYLTHTGDWYRRPIDPFFDVLAAYACVALFRPGRASPSPSPVAATSQGHGTPMPHH